MFNKFIGNLTDTQTTHDEENEGAGNYPIKENNNRNGKKLSKQYKYDEQSFRNEEKKNQKCTLNNIINSSSF